MRAFRWIALGVALAAAPAGATAQRPDQPPSQDRQALEARVLQQFVRQAAQRLELGSDASDALHRIVRDTHQGRRALAREAMQLRRQAAQALQSPAAADRELEALLTRLEALRARELELWRQEQAALARILTPRQRLQYLALQARFNERVQQLRRGGPGGVPPGGRPPAGDRPF